MCYSLPAQVIAVNEGCATVDLGGTRCEVGRAGIVRLRPGDWVLVNMGQVMRLLTPDEVQQTQEALRAVMAEALP